MKIVKKFYLGLLMALVLFTTGCSNTLGLITDTNQRVDTIQSDILDLESRLQDLENLLGEQNIVITQQNATISEQAQTILENANEINLLKTTIQAMTLTVELQGASITTLQNSLEAGAALIAENKLEIDTLKSDLTALDSVVTSAVGQIQLLDGLIQSLQTLSDSFSNSISSMLTSITQLQQDLAELAEMQNDTDDEISNILTTLNGLSATLSSYEETQENLDALITLLSNRVGQLELSVLNLEVITGITIQFEQAGYSLDASIQLDVPESLSINGYEYIGSNLIINHPLKSSVTGNPFVKQVSVNADAKEIDFSVLYHGMYKGDLSVLYSNGTDTKAYNFVLTLPLKSEHYNIAWLNATMPLLLFASDVLTGYYDNGFTYIEIERARTYDYAKLPNNVKPIPAYASPSLGNYNQTSVPNFLTSIDPRTGSAHAVAWLEELYDMNNNSTFTFATVDNVAAVITGVYMSKIPIANIDFVVYTDGSFTTWMLNTAYGGSSGYDNYGYRTIEFLDWAQKIDSGQTTTSFNTHFILPAVENANFKYVINSTSGLDFNTNMLAKFNTLDVRVTSVVDAFASVSAAGNLNALEYLLKTRWGDEPDQSMSVYFSGTPSKNLLILGTSPTAEANANYATFNKYIDYIVDNYGTEYKLFYKGHPSWPSSEDRLLMFANNDIAVLPNSIPVETLMLLYNDVYVGGYTSTSFQSSLVGQTLFFFGPQSLIEGNATLKSMIQAGVIFANTVYLIKDQDGNVLVQ